MKRFSYACTVGRLVPDGLEPYELPDGVWLAPCVAVATIPLPRMGAICAGDGMSAVLSFYTLRGTVVSYGVVLVWNREKQGVSLIIINYCVAEG